MNKSIANAAAIKLLILDVDGVLTNGVLYYGNDGMECKGFHIHDGLGMKLLQKTGVTLAVISGKNSQPVTRRLTELNIEHLYLGHTDKLPAYLELKQKLGFVDEEIAFVGDDLPDLPILLRVGLPITVPQAPEIIKKNCAYITKIKAGKGAVREVCELIMETQGTLATVLQSYLEKSSMVS